MSIILYMYLNVKPNIGTKTFFVSHEYNIIIITNTSSSNKVYIRIYYTNW